MKNLGSVLIGRGILPVYPHSGTGLTANNVPHSWGADVAPMPRPKVRGGPVQRGLGNKRASGVQTAATNLG